MSFTWTRQPPKDFPDLSDKQYAVWKFRQRAGVAHQDETYEGALSDEAVLDAMYTDTLTLQEVVYYQPLTTLANFIEADPEQRIESYEGDAKDKWTDPYRRSQALKREQEELNRRTIPGYVPQLFNPGPILTAWGRRA